MANNSITWLNGKLQADWYWRDSYVHSFSGRCLHNNSYRVTFIRVERKQETEYGDLSLVERTSATGPDTWQKTENGILS